MICSKLLMLCLLAAIVLCISAGPPRKKKKTTQGDEDDDDVDSRAGRLRYLKRFGFMGRRRGVKEAIKAFQRSAGIPATGDIDLASETIMNTPRCGVGLQELASPEADFSDYTILNSGWTHKDLTYRIEQYPAPSEMPHAVVDDTVTLAFKFWSDVSSLSFTSKSSGTVDIIIIFASGAHGDNGPFDGRGGTLAHAFSPYTGQGTVDSIHGDAHFDDGETWTINVDAGTNLLQVAVHEFGHSLGIGHSRVREAIMYPYYGGYIEDFKLAQDDIDAILSLYGSPDGVPTASPPSGETTTTEPPATVSPPPDCTVGFHKYPGMRRRGAKKIPTISTLEGCRERCEESASCWAFSYKNVRKLNARCFIHSLKTIYSRKLDFYLKKFNSELETSYQAATFTKHRGGLPVDEQISREECQDLCNTEEHCIGYSYRRETKPGQRWWCKLHIYPVSGNPRKMDHYVKYDDEC